MAVVPAVLLAGGCAMPQIGLGTWRIPDAEAEGVVARAIEIGYRSIDTAAVFGNEAGVGRGIRSSGLPRSEIFVTTKLWNTDHGYDSALAAFEASARRLGLDYVDLYLVNWPHARARRYVDSWRALAELLRDGRVRAIGVSNFNPRHLARIAETTGTVPHVNQIERHPFLQQARLLAAHGSLGVTTVAWSPLAQGRHAHPVVAALAAVRGCTPAQLVLRWHLERGVVVIPKSVQPERMRENLAAASLSLAPAELEAIDALEANGRLGPDPDRF